MLDWIFEGIANWVASIMTQLMDAVSGLFLDALGTDMTAMEEYFPFVVSAYNIIQYTAWAILFLTVVWQLFRAFGGPITEAENPWHLLVRGGVFAVLIAYAKPIFSMVLDIARAPYLALMDATMDPGDFTFAGIEQALTNGLTTFVSMVTVVGLLLLIIMMIALAWNYFKLLLETVERYVLVGVLCYTSPLAYSMGASKATSRVFQSWCRMVGSQLLLLVLNVWFLRAFNSSVGQFVANGGALTTGRGSIFLWLFCALALLKTAQKCDSHLAALGLSVAQTGSSMGMEMLMAARVIGGFSKGGGQTASSAFSGAGRTATGAGAAGAGSGTGGILSGFVNRYKPNSFVRDAVVDGGSRMGAGGSVGFVGRAFGGVAARNGATLTADSISSVASRPNKVSGTIAGEIADRSLPTYMPQLANGPTAGMAYSNTQITGGHISTTATGPDGRQSNVELFSSAQYDRPETPHTVVSAADGSQWYQVASGEGMGAFYAAPPFTGDQSEANQVSEAFPTAPEGTLLRQAGEGTLEASYPDGSNAVWYSSANYQEPDAPHETIQSSNGLDWYAMTPHAVAPQFDTGSESELSGQPPFNIGADGTAAGGSAVFGGNESLSGMSVGNAPDELGGGASSDHLGNGMPAAELNDSFSSATPVVPAEDGTPPVPPADIITNGLPADIPTDDAGDLAASGPAGGIGEMPSLEVPESGSSEPDTVIPSASISGDIPSGDMPVLETHAADNIPVPEADPAASASIPETSAAGGIPAPEPPPLGSMPMLEPPPPASDLSAAGGTFIPEPTSFSGASGVDQPASGGGQVDAPCVTGNVEAYNQALFGQFMPGFDRPAVSIDSSRAGDGILEVRHEDGSGTAFYDRTMYQQPRGDHRVFEDSSGGQWYAIPGTPAVERRPVYQDGKPVYDGDKLKTEMVETIRYKTTPARFAEPARRPARERKAPKKKT